MTDFSIEGFAQGCKQAMDDADNRHVAAKAFLEQTLRDNACADIIATLDAAIPEGADIGEMIVHQSPELTMLYGRVPPRFRSGIHNHTVFACIGQLSGAETSTMYERTPEDGGLRETGSMTATVGKVIALHADAIHHIENPNSEVGSALHIYGGDFGAVMDQRSLWTSDGYVEKPFTFPELVAESAKAMKRDNNQAGLDALVAAIPATKPMVDAL